MMHKEFEKAVFRPNFRWIWCIQNTMA